MTTHPSYPTDERCLSEQTMRAYVAGELLVAEQYRAERHLNECTLCASAMSAFLATPAAMDDLRGIHEVIAQKSGMKAAAMRSKLMWSGIGVAVLAGVGFYFWSQQEPTIQKTAEQQPTTTQKTPTTIANVQPERQEHFINPEAPKRAVVVLTPKQKADSAEAELPDWIEPIDVKVPQPLLPEEVKPGPAQPSYNSAFVYILDLKITGFDTYYRKSIAVQEPRLTGVPAQYDDSSSIDKNSVETTRSIPADRVLREALDRFNAGRYGACISKFAVLLKLNPNDVNALFYTGVSYVRLELPEKAIPFLDRVLAENNNVFHEEARWYKALALLHSGEYEKGTALLKQIANEPGFYQTKAKEMLKN